MIRLVKQALNSTTLAIGVYGDNALTLEGVFVSLFNCGAIDIANYRGAHESRRVFSELYPLFLHLGKPVPDDKGPGFRYALTTPAFLWAWVRYQASLAFDCERVSTPSLERYLDDKANKALAAIESETFLHYGESYYTSPDDMTTPDRCNQARAEIRELRSNPDALPKSEWYGA